MKRDLCLATHKKLIAHIDDFIASYNHDTHLFAWTKCSIHQKRLKPCSAIQ